jgi:hypothetical protein
MARNSDELRLSAVAMAFARDNGFNYLIKKSSCSPSNPSLPALEIALIDSNGKEQAYFWGNLNHEAILGGTLYFPKKLRKNNRNLCKLLQDQGYSIKRKA